MAGPFASTTLQFIADFRALHEKLRKGVLSEAERTRYGSLRQQFIRMMTISQIGVTGQTLRSDLRMSKMLKVEIRPADAPTERVTTLDIATKGFATLMPNALPVGSVCDFTLFLAKPASPIKGQVAVASARRQGTLVRTSFTFQNLPPDATEQLDITLVDAVLERFTSF